MVVGNGHNRSSKNWLNVAGSWILIVYCHILPLASIGYGHLFVMCFLLDNHTVTIQPKQNYTRQFNEILPSSRPKHFLAAGMLTYTCEQWQNLWHRNSNPYDSSFKCVQSFMTLCCAKYDTISSANRKEGFWPVDRILSATSTSRFQYSLPEADDDSMSAGPIFKILDNRCLFSLEGDAWSTSKQHWR